MEPKQKKKIILWSVVIAIIIVIVIFIWKDSVNNEESKSNNAEGTLIEGYRGSVLAGQESKYLDFNKQDYDTALNENKTVLLYFYANWCPICKREQVDTLSAFNEIDNPELIGFRVNYKDSDTDSNEEELAREFGISYQHTKVILKEGKQILKSPDGWSRDKYIEELSKL